MIELDFSKKINKNLSLNIKEVLESNKTYAIFGESGAGKSSFLKLISGILKIDKGLIKIDNVIFEQKGINNTFLPPQKRLCSFVFQNYSLFPNLNVKANILFGARKKQDKKNLMHISSMLNIISLLEKDISKLSGGEAQRVNLARALISTPKILLLDEPFSALDLSLKISIHKQLKDILEEFKITTFLVSHDKEEVATLAYKILEVQNGSFKKAKNLKEFILEKEEGYGNIVEIRHDFLIIKSNNLLLHATLSKHSKKVEIGDRVILTQNIESIWQNNAPANIIAKKF